METHKYTLECNSDQAHTIIQALDFFSRIGSCQIEELEHFVVWQGVLDIGKKENKGKREQIRLLCMRIKNLLGYPENAHAGIAQESVPEICRIAYDLECVIRKCVATAENAPSYSVWLHDPLHIVKEVPLAKCESHNIEE